MYVTILPESLQIPCNTIEQMQLANMRCWAKHHFYRSDRYDCEEVLPMTALRRYCCKSRKSNNAKNLAKVDLGASLLLDRLSATLRRSVVDFG